MLVKFIARAAVTGLVLSSMVSPVRAAAQGADLAADSTFLQAAGSYSLLQVKLGKIAEQKGSSAAVREFGKRMVADYSKVTEDLTAAARQAAYPAPLILRQQKQIVDRFLGMGRGSFDKNYMAEMVNDQNELVRLFQRESESGRVASLKQLASKILPAVQEHLALARQTAGSVGADVTASAQGARQGS